MSAPKIILSEAEQLLITNAGVILTKNAIVEKTCLLFSRLADSYQQQSRFVQNILPEEFSALPKISRGEKYEALPWVMLDYPRCFHKKNGQLAIRTFFWWGHFVSIQLQATGTYVPGIVAAWQQWHCQHPGWMAGYATNAWDYRLPAPNWEPIAGTQIPEDKSLKLAKKFELSEWDKLETDLPQQFGELLQLLQQMA